MIPDPVLALGPAWRRWEALPTFPFKPDCCINAARVGVEVLRRFGVKARPVSVELLLINRFGLQLMEAQVPVDQWPAHAHSIGITPGADFAHREDGWPGHLMIEGDDWTIDLSARQFARPGKLIVDGPWMLPPIPRGERLVLVDDYRQALVVSRWAGNNGWRRAPGWLRLHAEETDFLTALVYQEMTP